MVSVHHFLVWDEGEDEYVVPALKSTVERIERIKGEIIPDTEEEVDPSELDPEGRFDPDRSKGDNTPLALNVLGVPISQERCG